MGEEGSKRRNLTAVGLLLIRFVLAVHDAVAGAAEVDAVAVPALKLVVHVAGGIHSWAEHGNVSSARLRSASPPSLSSAPLTPLTFAGQILLQDPLPAAGAVDVALGGEQAQVLAATVVHPAWGQLA